MASNQSSQPIEADVRDQLDEIDGTLRDQLDQDERLTSGVPDEQRGDDLGFIQMTGLTRPGLMEARTTRAAVNDLDPSRPVNFYEAGVADVDASMDPGTYDSASADSEDIAVVAAPSESAKGLRELLAQLGSEGEEPVLAPEDEPPPPPLAVEDMLDPQSLVDAGGADVVRREVPTEGAPAATTSEPISAIDAESDANTEVQDDAPAVPDAALEYQDVTPTVPDAAATAESSAEYGSDLEESHADAQHAVMAWPAHETRVSSMAVSEPAAADDEPEASPITDFNFLQTPSIDESLLRSLDALDPETEDEAPAVADSDDSDSAAWPDPRSAADASDDDDGWAEMGPAPAFDRDRIVAELDAAVAMAEVRPAPDRGVADRFNGSDDARLRAIEAAELPAPAVDLEDSSPSWLQPQEGPLLARRQHRRSKSRKRSLRRKIRRWAIRGVLALVFLGALGAAAWVLRDMFQPPANFFNEAEYLSSQGLYGEASRRYEEFAQRNPGDALRPTAEFEAAHVLSSVTPASQDERVELDRRQLALYQDFIENNPGHPKVARAARLVTQLHYELGQYEDVIRNYRPELQAQDPGSALPALRLVARAYEQMGEYEQAESAYLRAAGMDGNLTPERDFEALADLHHRLAGQVGAEPSRTEHYTKALEYLDRASQSATLDPGLREQLRLKQSTWGAEMSSEANPETAGSAPPAPEAVLESAPDDTTAGTTRAEMAPDPVADRELDASAEADYLESVTGAPSGATGEAGASAADVNAP